MEALEITHADADKLRMEIKASDRTVDEYLSTLPVHDRDKRKPKPRRTRSKILEINIRLRQTTKSKLTQPILAAWVAAQLTDCPFGEITVK